MQFENTKPMTRFEAELAFISGSPEKIGDALIRVTFHDTSLEWVQKKCLYFAKDQNSYVRGIAATCFGHLARIHRKLDLEEVLPILKQLQNDPEVAFRADDALDDINTFLKVGH